VAGPEKAMATACLYPLGAATSYIIKYNVETIVKQGTIKIFIKTY